MSWRFEIINDSDEFDVVHYSGTDFSISWNREDDLKYDHELKIKDITFVKDDYKYFYDLEKSEDRCDLQTFNIYLLCGNTETLKATGVFSMSHGNWDLDRCKVTFKVSTLDAYSCIKENDEEINILGLGINDQTVSLSVGSGIETYTCASESSIEIPECDSQFILDGLWTFYKNDKAFDEDQFGNIIQTNVKIYVRDYLITDCDYEPGDEWTLLDACADDQKKYIKPHILEPGENLDDLPIGPGVLDAEDLSVSEIDNGMKLYEVVNGLLQSICPGEYLIVSDFFQWNPENETTINYVTGETNVWTNIIQFQKSDVKRPNTSNNATKAMIKFMDELEYILNIFNCRYAIKDGIVRIEHLSYFQNDLGINLITQKRLDTTLKMTKKYNYDTDNLVKYEKFEWMESDQVDFVGERIYYDSACVDYNATKEKTISIDKVTTDLLYVLNNGASDSDKVSDEGFVLIACDSSNKILSTDSILATGKVLNGPLSWSYLHEKLWRHGRVLKNGNMNGMNTEFTSNIPAIKQQQFTAILDCNEIQNFDPLDKIKGMLGWGYVDAAELNLSKCTITLDLLLEAIEDVDISITYGDFDDSFDSNFD